MLAVGLIVIEAGRSSIVLVEIAFDLVQRVPYSEWASEALSVGLVLIILSGNLLLGHFAVGWYFCPFDHASKWVVFIFELVDLGAHLVADGFDECLGVILYLLHFQADEFVLLVEFLEVAKCPVDVVLVPIFLSGESDFWLCLTQIWLHNGYKYNKDDLWDNL